MSLHLLNRNQGAKGVRAGPRFSKMGALVLEGETNLADRLRSAASSRPAETRPILPSVFLLP